MTASPVEGFPISAQQRAAWDAVQRGVSAPLLLELELDHAPARDVVARRLARSAGRHEILRTCFIRVRGMAYPVQVITDSVVPRFEPETAGVAQIAGEPLDPEHGPLVRCALVDRPDGASALLLVASPLVADAGSLTLLAAELLTDRDLPEDPLQYADYASWQQDAAAQPAAPVSAEFLAAGTPPLAPLLTTADAPAGTWVRAPVDLPAAAIRGCAAASGTTPADVLLAAWVAVASRVTGRRELVLMVEDDGRQAPEARGALGPYARAMHLHATADDTWSFAELVTTVARAREVASTRRELPAAPIPAPAVGFRSLTLPAGATRGVVTDARDGLWLDVMDGPVPAAAVEGDRPRPERIERLAALLSSLVAAGAARPDTRWNDLELAAAGGAPRHDGHAVPASSGPTAWERIAAAATRSPQRLAVGDAGGDVTYAALIGRAEAIAAALADRGIGRGSRVGLLAHRTADIAAAILGVLRCGAAWVPFDPEYPRERLAATAARAELDLLLTGPGLDDLLAAPAVLPLETIQSRPAAGPPVKPVDDDIAYVVHTSGSTGEPHGVALTHGGLHAYLPAIASALGIGEDDVYLHTASFAFSSSVRQLLMPLAQGATVLIADEATRRDPDALLRLIRDRGVTVAGLVPSHWRAVADAAGRLDPARRAALLDNRLRLIASASEPLPTNLVARWRELGHPARVINMYGATETTGIVCTRPLDGTEHPGVAPLGRPLTSVECFVVDARHRPLPDGAIGELVVAGPQVALGYIGEPGLTAARFIASPDGRARAFRTGDRVQLDEAGDYRFFGRLDGQVKLRGVRIELGDIERALLAHPGVAQAAVALRPDQRGEPRLVAYIVPQGPTPGADALRAHLAERLPASMLPATILALDALPLSPNGKLDRAALPAPESLARARASVAPRDDIEAALAALWADLLGHETVGVEDSFFELGGHSLLATQLAARVYDNFQIEVPLRALFEATTVARQAEALRLHEPRAGYAAETAALVLRVQRMAPDDVARELAGQGP